MNQNDSDHENEGAASLDPGFSAALAGSFKMDYFTDTNSAGLKGTKKVLISPSYPQRLRRRPRQNAKDTKYNQRFEYKA